VSASSTATSDVARALPRRKKPTVPFFWPEWIIQREIAEHARISLREFARGRTLDAGCGEKPFQVYRPTAVTQWVGFDVPENPVADVHGYAEALPFSDAFFDTVLCTEVIEHVEEPSAVLSEIACVLAPGGYLILTTPLYWPLHEEPYDFFRFTPYGLRHLCEKAGLQLVSARSMAVGFRMVALAINTCFNSFGKRLPLGKSAPVKALFIPVYIATNFVCLALSLIFPSATNSVGTAIVARKPIAQ
jgi:SAM-dependent methyltransferase